MRPLNLDNSPCTPTSSNCVIWSGPDLDCIKLCTGDTISDVVAKLATELCTILDTLNVSNYDLACLNLNTCAPSDFEQLIQLLIDKVCALENAPADPTNPPSTACPTDCIVATLGCLIGPDEPDDSDTLLNYIQSIAQRLCNLIVEVGIAQDAIAVLDVKVTALENAPVPTFIIPSFTLSCSIGTIPPVLAASSTQAIDVVLRRFINEEWCPYKAVFGTYTDLSNSIGSQCITGTDTAQALKYTFPGTQMQIAYPSYVGTPVTLSDAVNNLWIALCDVRNAGVQITDVVAGDNVTVTPVTTVVGSDEVTTYTIDGKDTIVTASNGLSVTSSTVGNTTTYDVGLTTPLSAIMPAGAVIPWASPNAVAPIGWLFCDGGSYDGALYPDLYAAIGATYGSTLPGWFDVPNMASSIPVGKGPLADGYDLTAVGSVGGNRAETLLDSQIPTHTHDLSAATITATVSGTTGATKVPLRTASTLGTTGDPAANPRTGDYTRIKVGADADLDDTDVAQQVSGHTHSFSGSASGTLSGDTGDGSPALQGAAHGNMQPYIVMQYIIKY